MTRRLVRYAILLLSILALNPAATARCPYSLPIQQGGVLGASNHPVVSSRARASPGAGRGYWARSKRSRFMTLSHAATKSCTNFSSAPSLP